MAHHVNRRIFLSEAVTAATLLGAQSEDERRGEMIYRTLGRTGQKVSAIGLGGSHIGRMKNEQEAIKLVRTAIDRGLTFMDNSWDYNNGDGQGEIKMGKALRDGYRQKCFLMTKVDGRTRDSAAKQIDESLKRLQTDRVDLMQFHEVIRMEDPDRIFNDDGAVHAFLDARKAGKIRYIGFTGHKDPAVHLRMLNVAQKHGFQFDTIMFPNNVMDAQFRSFGHEVLPVAQKQNLGILCMKPLGSGIILQSGTVNPIEALHFVLSQPVSVCINGCENTRDLNQAFEAVKTFRPMNRQQISSLLARTKQAASSGKYELFKTSNRFDSTAKNPQWLG
jgi:aryl-alcohol dehydrogenase-like predicted oxidoreductase